MVDAEQSGRSEPNDGFKLNAKRLPFIDALRGIAVFAVITVHTTHLTEELPIPWKKFAEQGVRGVQLFFVISAFTLFLSLSTRNRIEKRPYLNFFIRRFFRIAPLFYCAVIFYLLRDGSGPRFWLGDAPSITIWNLLATVTFTNGWNPYWFNSIVPGGWSVAVEMMFYLMVPYLYSKIKSLRSAVYLSLASLIFSKIFFMIAPQHPLIASKALWDNFIFLSLPNQFCVFSLGITLFFLLKHGPIPGKNPEKLGLFMVVTAIILLIALSFRSYVIPIHIVFSLCFVLLACGLALRPCGIIVNPFWRYLGKVSYSAYLTHFIPLPIVGNLMTHIHVSPIVDFTIALSLVLAETLAISTITFKFIEVPGQSLGRFVIAELEKK